MKTRIRSFVHTAAVLGAAFLASAARLGTGAASQEIVPAPMSEPSAAGGLPSVVSFPAVPGIAGAPSRPTAAMENPTGVLGSAVHPSGSGILDRSGLPPTPHSESIELRFQGTAETPRTSRPASFGRTAEPRRPSGTKPGRVEPDQNARRAEAPVDPRWQEGSAQSFVQQELSGGASPETLGAAGAAEFSEFLGVPQSGGGSVVFAPESIESAAKNALRDIGAEPRVHLWLSPIAGRAIQSSKTNVSAGSGNPVAHALLVQAGFTSAQIERFKADGLEVRHAFGADVGMNHLYVSVPRSKARALRRLAQGKGIQAWPSRGGFELHLLQSGPLQRLPGAWKLGFRGEGRRIYDIDTGIDAAHPDFRDDPPEMDDIVRDGPGDFIGHGTHKASISYARGVVYVGMAPKAKGRMGKVFARDGSGATDGNILAAAVQAMKWGADVISLSLGSPGEAGSPLSVFFSELTRQQNARGLRPIVTASAGNEGPFPFTIGQPGSGEEVDTSGASAKSLDDGVPEISFFSSVGPAVDTRWPLLRLVDKPDDAPLGGDVVTRPRVKDVYARGIEAAKSREMPPSPSDAADGLHTRMAGTSMSNPMNAGIDALIDEAIERSIAPGSDAETFYRAHRAFAVKMIRKRVDRDMGVPTWYQGTGFPDAEAAVRMALSSFGERPKSLGRWAAALFKYRRMGLDLGKEGFDWIRRARDIRGSELQAYQAAQRSIEASGENEAGYRAARERFDAVRKKILPGILRALKDPVWIVRRTAAFSLINLRAPESVVRSNRASADGGSLLESALEDPDPRVRQVAFLAVAAAPTRAADANLKRTLDPEFQGPADVALYAAYVLARHGDRSGVPRIVRETRNPDKRLRFTAVWLMGQLGPGADRNSSEALSAVLDRESERGNIRHLAVSSLTQLALENPGAMADEAFRSLLRNAGTKNAVLTGTIARFFPEAIQRREIVTRLRSKPLRDDIARFILEHRSSIGGPGPLGQLVGLLSRILALPIASKKSEIPST